MSSKCLVEQYCRRRKIVKREVGLNNDAGRIKKWQNLVVVGSDAVIADSIVHPISKRLFLPSDRHVRRGPGPSANLENRIPMSVPVRYRFYVSKSKRS